MTVGQWVLLVAVVVALGFGGWRAASDGRFRGTRRLRGLETGAGRPPRPAGGGLDSARPTTNLLADTPYDGALGERATLLQFSSSFCAPCRATRRVLAEVAGVVPGVAHVEVDAEAHLDLVRRLGIARTPTTLVLDATGHEVTRASGPPRKEQVLAALVRGMSA